MNNQGSTWTCSWRTPHPPQKVDISLISGSILFAVVGARLPSPPGALTRFRRKLVSNCRTSNARAMWYTEPTNDARCDVPLADRDHRRRSDQPLVRESCPPLRSASCNRSQSELWPGPLLVINWLESPLPLVVRKRSMGRPKPQCCDVCSTPRRATWDRYRCMFAKCHV